MSGILKSICLFFKILLVQTLASNTGKEAKRTESGKRAKQTKVASITFFIVSQLILLFDFFDLHQLLQNCFISKKIM